MIGFELMYPSKTFEKRELNLQEGYVEMIGFCLGLYSAVWMVSHFMGIPPSTSQHTWQKVLACIRANWILLLLFRLDFQEGPKPSSVVFLGILGCVSGAPSCGFLGVLGNLVELVARFAVRSTADLVVRNSKFIKIHQDSLHKSEQSGLQCGQSYKLICEPHYITIVVNCKCHEPWNWMAPTLWKPSGFGSEIFWALKCG